MKRFDISDKEFALIKDVATYKPPRGPEPKQIREMLDAILFVLCTGIPWRCLPDAFPPWRSVYARFRAYQKIGIFEQILVVLQKVASAKRQMHLALICVDGSYIRAHRHAAGAVKKNDGDGQALGRSRGGFTTKIHMICDQRGNPLFFVLTAGNVHDSKAFAHLLRRFLEYAAVMGWSQRFSLLVGDKGYDSARICEQCNENGIVPVIPKRRAPNGENRSDPLFDKAAYRRRNVIERCFGWLKECRRVATRCEKLAATYAAMLYLACAKRMLRIL